MTERELTFAEWVAGFPDGELAWIAHPTGVGIDVSVSNLTAGWLRRVAELAGEIATREGEMPFPERDAFAWEAADIAAEISADLALWVHGDLRGWQLLSGERLRERDGATLWDAQLACARAVVPILAERLVRSLVAGWRTDPRSRLEPGWFANRSLRLDRSRKVWAPEVGNVSAGS